MKKNIPLVTAICVSLALVGCESNTAMNAAIGAAAGAIAGKATGNHKDKRLWIGAAIGALAGAAAGQYMDAQEAEFKQQLADSGVEVVREGDNIRLIMPSNITFASDQSNLSSSAFSPLNAIARVMKKYDKTLLSVDGFTDSTGNDSHNLTLSQQRADTVKNYLVGQGIDDPRLIAKGMGMAFPIAENSTPEGRALNRRVEIQVIPNSA